MMAKTTKLGRDEIVIGEPIPWDLVNDQGTILFRKGFVFNSQLSAERVMQLQLQHACNADYCEEEIKSPFVQILESDTSHIETLSIQHRQCLEELASLMIELKQWQDSVVAGVKVNSETIRKIARGLQQARRLQPQAGLAAVQLFSKYPHAVYHPVAIAILCASVADHVIHDNAELIESFICAALTANISLYAHIENINKNSAKLTQNQYLQMLYHPTKSARLLRAVGVKDPVWTELVQKHHEDALGKGYPNAIKLSKYEREINIYNLADTYLSLTGNRAYRERISCDAAMEKLHDIAKLDNNKHLLFKIFRKILGKYPNGSLVKLENNETALVYQQHPESIDLPILISPVGSYKKKTNRPQLIRAEKFGYAILHGLVPPVSASVDLVEMYCANDIMV